MGQTQHEQAQSIVLRGCRNTVRLQAGGWWIIGWFTTLYRRMILDSLIRHAGFSSFGSRIHRFSRKATDGYTYVMIIGQSSINIHTYPESGTATVWIITCPGEDDDGSATEKFSSLLEEYFQSASVDPEMLGKIPLGLVV